jgi:cobalt-zinc-cadmium efflux system outer membrane protein
MGVAHPDTDFAVSGELRFEPLDLPLDSLEFVALESRADLAAAERRAAQARALQGEARSNLIPIPALSLVHQTAPFSNGSFYALGVSLTVPIFDWNGAARERAAAALEAATIDVARKRAEVSSAVAAAVENHVAARTLASRYAAGVLEQARLALEGVRYGYSRGNRSLVDLLDALRSYGEVRSDYYDAIHDYWVSAYALTRTAGKELLP